MVLKQQYLFYLLIYSLGNICREISFLLHLALAGLARGLQSVLTYSGHLVWMD